MTKQYAKQQQNYGKAKCGRSDFSAAWRTKNSLLCVAKQVFTPTKALPKQKRRRKKRVRTINV